MKILRSVGKSFNIFLQKVGGVTKFIISIFSNLMTLPIYGGEIAKAFFQITAIDG